MNEHYQNLKQNFAKLGSWQDKYRQIMLLGKQLPALPEALKVDGAKVNGCESNVWLYIDFAEDEKTLVVSADSDTRIVKGLIYIISTLVNGESLESFRCIDIQQEFEELGLIEHLSPSRGNGIRAIASTIDEFVSSQVV